jgi:hypothetical protein
MTARLRLIAAFLVLLGILNIALGVYLYFQSRELDKQTAERTREVLHLRGINRELDEQARRGRR